MYCGGALFPDVFKDMASPRHPTAGMQTTQRPARGVCAPPHVIKQQFGLGKVTVQKDALQGGAVIMLLSKKAAFAWEKWGVQDPIFPVVLVRTPEHVLGELSPPRNAAGVKRGSPPLWVGSGDPAECGEQMGFGDLSPHTVSCWGI